MSDDTELTTLDKIQLRLGAIASRQEVIERALKAEEELARERNSADCAVSNNIHALAKELHDALGLRTERLIEELVAITHWQPRVLTAVTP
jgi:hypothetical protein